MTEPVRAGARAADMAVLAFGGRRVPRPLTDLAVVRVDDAGDPAALDAAVGAFRRLVVLGGDAELAAVLTRLLRAERLDVEVAYAPRRRTRATGIYRLPAGFRAARRATLGAARRVPLIRDETGSVVVGRAGWVPADGARTIRGEAVVDDTTLFDGDAPGVWIEPTPAAPGLRAAVAGRFRRRWVAGRAAQLGSTGVAVLRDGVPAARPARRCAFYRNIEGWLSVR
ncbi:peptidase M50 [Mycobacterium sp. 94-17]|uniref:peptidase M50 n=1 Tax=Mycobacterium sp. 94-17 TaxID=2986147 RepID=UPI002D1E5547|nr:peptidase M50 [Mycobacterium sp. 94-17]MEB4208461.1 peptidase M50 [Mycobacterium sp. 94-17]